MTDSPRILFLTKYARNGASSRYRSYQYLPYLERAGLRCIVAPLFDEAYLWHKYRMGRPRLRDVIRAFLRRVRTIVTARQFDLAVIEKELLPYGPALPEWLLRAAGIPYVVDYDDALFHQYDRHRRRWVRALLGGKIARVMRGAALVMAGNEYLAAYARQAGARRVEILPTVVDLDEYPTPCAPKVDGDFTFGWIGSPATARYLQSVAPALAQACAGGRGKLRLIGSGPVDLPEVPQEVVSWRQGEEAGELRAADVGIMPLPDTPWERGKCGFKLIQYMACGLPVVASPVGVNTSIVEEGVNGFLARDESGWIEALQRLQADADLRARLGAAGRARVERSYNLAVTAPRLAELLREQCGGRS